MGFVIFAFKKGRAPHLNTFELGQHGRYRTNVWDYACAENNRNPVTEDGWTLTLDTDGEVIDVEVPTQD